MSPCVLVHANNHRQDTGFTPEIDHQSEGFASFVPSFILSLILSFVRTLFFCDFLGAIFLMGRPGRGAGERQLLTPARLPFSE